MAEQTRPNRSRNTFRSTAKSKADASRMAITNTEIDGGTVLPETRELMNRWVAGDLTDDELIKAGIAAFGRAAGADT